MSKITLTEASPDEWSPELENRQVVYDPLHGEMVGYDADDAPRAVDERSFEMELVGDYAYPELVGDEEEEEEEEEEGEDDPDTEQEDVTPPEGVSDFTEPGTPYGGQKSIPEDPEDEPPGEVSAADGPVKAVLAARAAANIRAKVLKGHPRAIAAVKHLAMKAKTSPAHKHAIKAIAKRPSKPIPKKPRKKFIKGRGWVTIRGEVFMGRTIHGTVGQILSTALTPVAYVTHATGTAINEVGSLLEKLARKL